MITRRPTSSRVTHSGHDRYWTACMCGWSSRRLLDPQVAYDDWNAHRRSSQEAGTADVG
jgi:hypothetical protein